MTANVRHSSENSEFMSPQWLTDWVHYVMGGIDLDPASSHEANRTVRANMIYTKAENGLFKPWHGRVWLNPPGGLVDETGREVIVKSKTYPGCKVTGDCGLPPGHKHSGVESSACFWWHKLVHEFEAGNTTCAMFLGFSLEILQSAQSFAGKQPLDFPDSIPKQRIRFETEDEYGVRHQASAPTHANMIVLVTRPPDGFPWIANPIVERFIPTFSQIGYVHVPGVL